MQATNHRMQAQLEDNLGALELELSGEHRRKLDQASQIELGFPRDLLLRPLTQHTAFGELKVPRRG